MTHPIVQLTIDELAGGGDGVAHTDDRAVFVPGTAPGDTVRARVRNQHRRWSRAELVEVVEAGPDRQRPACGVADRCGGCQWQHVTYEAQLRAKQQLLRRAFRQARLDADPEPLVPAPDPLAYRCRARLHWTRSQQGSPALGFLGARSHRVVDIRECPVLLPPLSALLPRLREWLPQDLPEAELSLLGNEQGHCALGLQGELKRSVKALAVPLAGVRGAQRLDRSPATTLWGDPHLDQEPPGATPFWTSPATFFQANPAVNRLLRDQLADWAGASSTVLELFAGSGNLTRTLAGGRAVVAVESQPAAAALAQRNLDMHEVQWMQDDAAAALLTLADEGIQPELVVLDPPRTGARELLEGLVRLGAPRILYVSCDPMTLARDVAGLAAQGYVMRRLRALDTMPQTSHFETVAELRLRL